MVTKTESKVEIYLIAFEALSKAERNAVLSPMLDDEEFREDFIDIALIRQRQNEPARPFSEYVTERQKRASRK